MRFTTTTVAAIAACSASLAGAFTINQRLDNAIRRTTTATTTTVSPFFPSDNSVATITTSLNMAVGAPADAQAAILDAVNEAGTGVALFGKSGCPFCKKAKKALYGIGVHPVIVELDVVENGSAIQSALEDSTGKSTVPNVWLDGKFIGGSEEVLKGVEDGMFDAVEKKEVIVMEEEEKVPIVQGPDCIKVGDKLPTEKLWTAFGDPEAKVDLLEYSKDKSIVIVGLPGAFTPT
mmetsp:Transcript_32830/g.79449  ORF Transcript_32830/g.79449 Transcript_32830/m.79449 type:complete len:234 (-) Transcript_32830:595-1296(-)